MDISNNIVTVNLPDALLKKVDDLANKNYSSRSQVIRDAILNLPEKTKTL